MSAHHKQPEQPELGADELSLLAAFAQEEQLSAAVRGRVKARVLESIVAATPTGTVLRGPWLPWVAGSVLAAAAAALLVITMSGDSVTAQRDRGLQQAPDTPEAAQGFQARQESEPSPTRKQRPANTTPPVPPPLPAAPRPVTPVTVHAPAPSAEAPAASRPPRRGTTPRKSPKSETPATPSPSSLAEETRLLERARAAVTENRPSEALGILRDAQESFPGGVLRQERAVLRVVALCGAGKLTAGRTAAAAFLRAHPRSALRSRVESACPEATP